MGWLNAQASIVIGAVPFVLYLAGVPLVKALWRSDRSTRVGDWNGVHTYRIHVKACVGQNLYLPLLNSVHYSIRTCTLTFLQNSPFRGPRSIMAFDLWERGQYTYIHAFKIWVVFLLIAVPWMSRRIAAKLKWAVPT